MRSKQALGPVFHTSLLMGLLMGASACPRVKPMDAPAQGQGGGPLVILHTNDLHGQFLPNPAPWLPGRPEIGGMERLDAYVRSTRRLAGDGNVLVLDAGDLLTGGPLAELEVNGATGGAMTEFLAEIGYDALTLGNHDFDKGFDNTSRLVASSRVPFVSANLYKPSGEPSPFPELQPSLVMTAAGIRVGVIGGITMELPELVSRDVLTRLKLADLTEAVRAEVERLDPETDLIVVLCHCGMESDRALAQAVPTIDLIVGGHSHTALKAPERIGDTWIVQAGSNGRSVGHVELTVKDDEIATIEGRLVDLIEPGPGPQGASDNVMSRVSSYRRRIEAAFGAVVGVSSTVLGRKDDSESALGAWTTDMLRRATGANLAIFNGGGLRADLPAGSLTVGAIHGVFPFANPVAVFTMAGADVERLLLQIARSEHAADGSFVQFSGASLTWRLGPLGPEIVRADLGGQDLDVARQYRVATNSYVVEQWQRHLPVEPRDVTLLEKTVYDVAVEAVKAGPVDAPADWERRSVRLP